MGYDESAIARLGGGVAAHTGGRHPGAGVRGEDFAFAVDGQVSPGSAREMVELVMPDVEKRLMEQRLEARARAKAKQMGAMGDGR